MYTKLTKALVVLAALSLLLAPAGVLASAEATTQRFPVHYEFYDEDWCAPGDWVFIIIDGIMVIHNTTTSTGSHYQETLVWTSYAYSEPGGELLASDKGIQKFVLNVNPQNFNETYLFVANGMTDDDQPWRVTFVMHQTVNPDGTLSVTFEHENLVCGW